MPVKRGDLSRFRLGVRPIVPRMTKVRGRSMPPYGTLEFSREAELVRLRATRPSGVVETAAVTISQTFDDEAIWETLEAMGLVARDMQPPRLLTAADLRQIGVWLTRTTAYFDGPDEPAPRLWTVISAVRGSMNAVQRGLNIPLEAYAWLDVRWRDELADEVRAADGLWKEDELRLELERRRDKFVAEWLKRFEAAPFGEPAPSQRTRGEERRGETG